MGPIEAKLKILLQVWGAAFVFPDPRELLSHNCAQRPDESYSDLGCAHAHCPDRKGRRTGVAIIRIVVFLSLLVFDSFL